MHGHRSAPAKASRSAGDGFDIFDSVDSGRQVVAECVLFFSTINAYQDEDSTAHAGIAKGHAFIGGSDPEPAGTLLLKSECTGFGAVSVGVALDDGADLDVRPDVLLKSAKVMAQGGKGNLSPVRARRRTNR